MRIGGQSARHAQGKAKLTVGAARRSQSNVVDLGIGAPNAASRNADFEFARKIVELGVAGELAIGLGDELRGVKNLVAINTSERASDDVAYVVATGAHRGKTGAPQVFQQVGEIFDRHPVKLYVLADGDVGFVTCVLACDISNGAHLVREQQSVGNANAHHEVRDGFAFAASAANGADSVALGVHAPESKVRAQPLRRNRRMALTGKGANFVEAFPSVLLALEPLDSLCLGFFDFGAHRSPLAQKKKNPRVRTASDAWVGDKPVIKVLGCDPLPLGARTCGPATTAGHSTTHVLTSVQHDGVTLRDSMEIVNPETQRNYPATNFSLPLDW